MANRVLIGRYRIVRHLARGGMAEVYLAHDQLLNRPVAVKVLFPELAGDPPVVERFRREAQAAAALNHPNIVSVYDFGEDEGSYFMVMEYVEGKTLREVLDERGPLAPREAAMIAADIAAALAVAHRQGIVHRDVKPANVIMARTVKVADFGIARALHSRDSNLTLPGAVMGTATYLSPEQAQGQAIDHRSDIYSLGVVLYEMLAGRPPFSGDSPVSIAYKHAREMPPPVSSVNPEVPRHLEAVVGKAMAKDPDARYGSAAEFLADLQEQGAAMTSEPTQAMAAGAGAVAATQAIGATPGPPTSVLPPVAGEARPHRPAAADAYRRRRQVAMALVILVVLAAIALAIAMNSDDDATAIVPDLIGLTTGDAEEAVDRAGLKSRLVEEDRPGPAGRVLDQDPPAGTSVDTGATVSLVVKTATTTSSATATTRATTTTKPTTTTSLPPTTAAPATTAVPPPTSPPATVEPPLLSTTTSP